MDYQRIYDELVKEDSKSEYIEVHHIIPRCIGGDDSPSNLVKLSAREHFLAHWLLTKIHKGNSSLIYAFNMMCVGRKLNSHLYKYAREKVSNEKLGKSWGNHTEETKRKMSAARKGVKQGPRSLETRQKLSNIKKGHVQSIETIEKRCSKTRKPVIGVKNGEEYWFNSIKDAADSTGSCGSTITKVCKGKKKTHKGYVWYYADSK